jgi:hypothetical protein
MASEWINPTETLYDLEENLQLLKDAIEEWKNRHASSPSRDDNNASMSSQQLMHHMLDAVLHPCAVSAATERLLTTLLSRSNQNAE